MNDPKITKVFNRDDYIKAVYTEDGREQGLELGREQGESNRNKAIALNMLNMNMDIDTISKATGLSIEEIESLKTES